MTEWYRVTDPLSPLHGCDVSGCNVVTVEVPNCCFHKYLEVSAVRRVDVFMGDRPFQRVAPAGESLGLLIRRDILVLSPIQDDIIELATDRPYGKCLDEYRLDRSDGAALRVAVYQDAVQVALDDIDLKLLTSTTYTGSACDVYSDELEAAFRDGATCEELTALMSSSEA